MGCSLLFMAACILATVPALAFMIIHPWLIGVLIAGWIASIVFFSAREAKHEIEDRRRIDEMLRHHKEFCKEMDSRIYTADLGEGDTLDEYKTK